MLIKIYAYVYIDDFCGKVNCGKGNCSADGTKPFGFVCKCDPGWRRTRSEDDDDDHDFLPCVIPDCKINHQPIHATN